MAKKIMLDAGHYGKWNNAPTVKEYWESEMAWKLHLLLKSELEKYGFVVKTTRTNMNVDRGLYDRGACSEGCDLFISLHSNAVDSKANESVDYPVAIVPISGKGDKLGEKLAKCLEDVMETKQKGQLYKRKSSSGGEYYGVIRGAVAVGVIGIILEHSFHTCTRIAKWLLDENNLAKLAKEEAKVIAEYYGMTKEDETKNYTTIMGKSVATVKQMADYIKKVNPNVAESVINMIPYYISEGELEGVRGDIAFAQSCVETGNFGFGGGTAVTIDQNNFCGMGVVSLGVKGNVFETPQLGIRAQIQHLKAYASKGNLATEKVDPRFDYVTRECAKYVEWLGSAENPNGYGWAVGEGYGTKILTVLNKILEIEDDSKTLTQEELNKKAQKFMNEYLKTNLVVDGIIGSKSKDAMNMTIQKALNVDFKENLVVDGDIGNNSKTAMKKHLIKLGYKGEIVTAIELALMINGYNCKLENPSIYDEKLMNMIKDFQKKNNLDADGIVGINTYTKLFHN